MSEIKITYETLFDLLRRERNREELQPLEASFFTDVLLYMAEKKSLLDSERNKVQFHNIKKILKELYDRREKKILSLAVNAVRIGKETSASNCLPEERMLLLDIQKKLSHYRREVLDNLLKEVAPFGAALPKTEPKEIQKSVVSVQFLRAVPRFAGSSGTVYGPFAQGDEADLPPKIAAVLLKKNTVKEKAA